MIPPLTADLFSRAIIASAVSFGDHPLVCFEGVGPTRYRRALPAAALGVMSAAGITLDVAARILGISPSAVSVNKRRARPAFRRAVEAAREAAVYHIHGLELKARAQPCAEPGEEPEVEVVEPRGCAPAVEVVQPPSATIEQPPRITPAPSPAPSRPAAKAKPARQGRAIPKGARFENLGEGVSVIRLKPITDSVLRHARQQAARGVDVDDLADLFGVDADQLRRRLNEGDAA